MFNFYDLFVISSPLPSSQFGGCFSFELCLIADENSPAVEWKIRHKIAAGTARGLYYLHKGCQRRIIHRDIKSSNILLTADFEPQVCFRNHIFVLPLSCFHQIVVDSSVL